MVSDIGAGIRRNSLVPVNEIKAGSGRCLVYLALTRAFDGATAVRGDEPKTVRYSL